MNRPYVKEVLSCCYDEYIDDYYDKSQKYMKIQDNKIKALEKRCGVLEKALDNACEKLEYCSKERGVFNVTCDKQYWKERFMKGEKNE